MRQVVFPSAPLRTVREVLPHHPLRGYPLSPRPSANGASRRLQPGPVNGRLLLGWLVPEGTHPQRSAGPALVWLRGLPSGRVLLSLACSRYYAPLRLPLGWLAPDRGGPLQFRVGRSRRSASLTPEGSWGLHFPGLHPFRGLRPALRGSAPSCPACAGGITGRQTSLYATDRRFACLPFEGFVSGLRRRDLARRRRSATRRLGPYRDRTYTG